MHLYQGLHVSSRKDIVQSRFHGSTEYFKPPHTYYAIAAIVVLVVFEVPAPLVLTVVSNEMVQQRCLDVCRLRNNLLTAFTDAYLGCYKDGLNGTSEIAVIFCHGLYFVIRIIVPQHFPSMPS